ncbi:hypothetical protein ACHAPU_009481 [Fusarium lateritium]
MAELYKLSATDVVARTRDGQLSVEEYAQSLLGRIKERDPLVKGWAYINPDQVLSEARKLDQVSREDRGPLHGVAIAVKDVIFTKDDAKVSTNADMPTQFNSPIYKDDAPQVDAASIIILRKAGALILGKTTTTEFAATNQGPETRNPRGTSHTPGGSSSGSGAVVADLQAPISLGTQTGGSIIRPASFNGIYGFKPTWNSISREGQKVFSLMLDTVGMYARNVADLNLLADVFALEDDQPPPADYIVQKGRFAVCKTMVWPEAGPGLVKAMDKAVELLRSSGATVDEIEFPEHLQELPQWHSIIFKTDGRTAFLPEYRVDKSRIANQLVGFVENDHKISRATQLKAFDEIAAARPVVDAMLAKYDAVLTPSVPDEAPRGIEWTGSASFNLIWTALHVPVINIPGFAGENRMPIGLSLVAPRYNDRKLLVVGEAVGKSTLKFLRAPFLKSAQTRGAVTQGEREQQQGAPATAEAEAVERMPPCLGCLNSALAGESDWKCWQCPDTNRYERCISCDSCKPIPPAAVPMALFFLDFCVSHPVDADLSPFGISEKEDRRDAVETVMAGIANGEFPTAGDPRLS